MAFCHQSVNAMSKVYLANERRYNYTTPKSFLELVRICSTIAIVVGVDRSKALSVLNVILYL